MSHRCLLIEFELSISAAEWEAHCHDFVGAMRALPGLEWKLWLIDEVRGTGGGIYLFSSAASAEAYATGPVVASLRESTAVRNVRVRILPVADELSEATFALRSTEGGSHAVAS
jgi:Putative mono-oxygenase ydhR